MKAIQYIFTIISILHGYACAEGDRSKLLFEGKFTSAWHTREDGTTAMLYKGNLKWDSKGSDGQVLANLTASSHQVSVEPQSNTEYRLFYEGSKKPLILQPQNIVSILQEAMQSRIY